MLTAQTPSSPYRPWSPQEMGTEGFYAPTNADANGGTIPRPRRTMLFAISAALVIGALCVVIVHFATAHQPTTALIVGNATATATRVLSARTPTPKATLHPTAVATPSPVPTATQTATPAPTATQLPPITYDDTAVGSGANQFNFQGNTAWSVDTNAGYSGGSDHYAKDASDSMTFTFTGTRVQFVSAKGTNYGIVGITINNGTEHDVDCYASTTTYNMTIFDSGRLAKNTYMVKIFPTGNKNSASSDTYVAVDALIVTP